MAEQKDITPSKVSFPQDTREKKEAQDPRNTYQHKTRSGHLIEMCDNDGAEHVTIQHRSGSMIQFQPDGKIVITSAEGRYTTVFGEDRMYVTGAHDIVVDGAASLRVTKDYNVTVDGDMNLTVTGNMNTVVGKNEHTLIVGNQVLRAKNQTTKIKENTEHSTEGKTLIGSDGDMQVSSTKGNITVGADQNANFVAGKSNLLESKTANLDIKSKTGMQLIDSSGIDLNP